MKAKIKPPVYILSGNGELRLDEQRIAGVKRERQRFLDAAQAIELGEPLNEFDRKWFAAYLRWAATQIPTTPPNKKRGHQAELDPVNVATRFAQLVVWHGRTRISAREEIADGANVSVEAVKNALKIHGNDLVKIYKGIPNVFEQGSK